MAQFWAQELPAGGRVPVTVEPNMSITVQNVARSTPADDGASGLLAVEVGGQRFTLGIVKETLTISLSLHENFTLVSSAPFPMSVLGAKQAYVPPAAAAASPVPAKPAGAVSAADVAAMTSALDSLARPTTPAVTEAPAPAPAVAPAAPYTAAPAAAPASSGATGGGHDEEEGVHEDVARAAARRQADEDALHQGMKNQVAEMIAEAWADTVKEKEGAMCKAKKHFADDEAKYQAAVKFCTEHNCKFTDNEFEASRNSLCYNWGKRQEGAVNDGEDVSEDWQTALWKRPEMYFKKGIKPQVFDDTIEPDDIVQGDLGDCYLLSALSVMAERTGVINRLFVNEKQRPDLGVYVVKLCIQGHWRHLLLDDQFPCYPGKEDGNNGPMFSRGKGDEMWVMLVEKAWAKIHGTYQHIIWGLPGECLTNLTGAPCKFIHQTRDDLWEQVYKATSNEKGSGSHDWHVVALMPDDPEHDLQKELGLVEGHAYGVLDARIICGQKLLQLRNPWGNTEWKGDWSDNDKKHWTEQAISELGTEDAEKLTVDDGSFWMAAVDFQKYFAGVQVCRDSPGWIHTSEELNLRHNFINVMTMTITGTEIVSADITVSQEDRRFFFLDPRYKEDSFEYIGVRIYVLEAESCKIVTQWPLSNLRDVWVEAKDMAPGKYWVLVETDWDGQPCLGSRNKNGREVLPVGISFNHSPSKDGAVELLDPAFSKKIDGHVLKHLAFKHMCSEIDGVNLTRYDTLFAGVAGASKITKAFYECGGDSYAWLYKNGSAGLHFTEKVKFQLANMEIDGAMPGVDTVDVDLHPGQSKLVLIKQVKAGKVLHWSAQPDVELEEL